LRSRALAIIQAPPANSRKAAIITIDSDACVTGWNTGACNLFGWTETEALGMDSRLTFTPEDRERVQPEVEIARALARGRAENERWHMRKDGSRFWGSGLLLPLRGAQAGGFLKIMLDRTDRREAEQRQGSRMSLVGDDLEHVGVVPGGLLAPPA